MRRCIATTFADEAASGASDGAAWAVEPGSEAQIDYGRLGMWCDPASASGWRCGRSR